MESLEKQHPKASERHSASPRPLELMAPLSTGRPKPGGFWSQLEVSQNRGSPSHHPFLDGVFPHPAIGVPRLQATYNDSSMGDLQVRPELGNVAFGSGLHGWGFSLETFAKILSAKSGMAPCLAWEDVGDCGRLVKWEAKVMEIAKIEMDWIVAIGCYRLHVAVCCCMGVSINGRVPSMDCLSWTVP